MKDLYRLKSDIVKELKELGGQGISKSNIEMIDKLAHAAKNIEKVIEDCENEEYSNAMGYSRRSSYANENYHDMDFVRPDGSYRDGGSSYARGRGRSASRDAMGRYSGDGSIDERTKEELMKMIEKM